MSRKEEAADKSFESGDCSGVPGEGSIFFGISSSAWRCQSVHGQALVAAIRAAAAPGRELDFRLLFA
jgi:hypothetical protein